MCCVGSGEMVEGVRMQTRQLYQWHKEAVRTDTHRLRQESLHDAEDPGREAYVLALTVHRLTLPDFWRVHCVQ